MSDLKKEFGREFGEFLESRRPPASSLPEIRPQCEFCKANLSEDEERICGRCLKIDAGYRDSMRLPLRVGAVVKVEYMLGSPNGGAGSETVTVQEIESNGQFFRATNGYRYQVSCITQPESPAVSVPLETDYGKLARKFGRESALLSLQNGYECIESESLAALMSAIETLKSELSSAKEISALRYDDSKRLTERVASLERQLAEAKENYETMLDGYNTLVNESRDLNSRLASQEPVIEAARVWSETVRPMPDMQKSLADMKLVAALENFPATPSTGDTK